MGSLWSYRYRPMRVFTTVSTTMLFIGVPLLAAKLVAPHGRVNRSNGENIKTGQFFATFFQGMRWRRLQIAAPRGPVAAEVGNLAAEQHQMRNDHDGQQHRAISREDLHHRHGKVQLRQVGDDHRPVP